MEFMQFHPTVLYIAGSSRSLITEAMRGEGARLGRRARACASCPTTIARASWHRATSWLKSIVSQMEKTRHPNVYLDVSHLPADKILARFPGIAATCRQFGIDITTDRIPVRPGAHYMIGGVTVDAQGRTTIPGLWAAGEVTSSGLHGANRLASNSLLGGTRVRGSCRTRCLAGGAANRRRLPRSAPGIFRRSSRRTSRWIWATSAIR